MCKSVPLLYRTEIAYQLGILLIPDYMKILLFSEFEKDIEFESKLLISQKDLMFYINNIFKPGGLSKVIKQFSKSL